MNCSCRGLGLSSLNFALDSPAEDSAYEAPVSDYPDPLVFFFGEDPKLVWLYEGAP